MAPRTPAQRAYAERQKAARLALPPIPCACGCGTAIPPLTALGKPARFAHGHNPDGEATRFAPQQAAWNKGQPSPWASATHKGKRLTADEVARRTATRIANNGGAYQTKRGWSHTSETLARMREANSKNARWGPANHAWEGGKSFEPYDEGFNAATKRAVLLRDKWACQDCGARLGDRVGARKPNIHHVDLTKTNSDPANLTALCVPCHAQRHWAIRKAGATVGG